MYTRTFSHSVMWPYAQDTGPWSLSSDNTIEIKSDTEELDPFFENMNNPGSVIIEIDGIDTKFIYYRPLEKNDTTYYLFMEDKQESPLKIFILGDQEETFNNDDLLEPPGPEGSDPLPICFMPGTLIATPEGPRAVETLQAGDLVCTVDGRSVPVVWMGRQSLHKLFTPAERFCPIRIRAGALAPGVPERDLLVTADHALMLDGLAVNAAALVNGRSILREPKDALPEKLTYWHIETAAHDVVLAESAPAETFVDNVTRRRFDNYADYEARFGAERRHIEESPAPRVMSRRQLPESLRMRLAARADELEQAETAA